MCVRVLTVQPDVMVGEDGGTVALGNPSHGDMQHSMGGLHIMLLTNQKPPDTMVTNQPNQSIPP